MTREKLYELFETANKGDCVAQLDIEVLGDALTIEGYAVRILQLLYDNHLLKEDIVCTADDWEGLAATLSHPIGRSKLFIERYPYIREKWLLAAQSVLLFYSYD